MNGIKPAENPIPRSRESEEMVNPSRPTSVLEPVSTRKSHSSGATDDNCLLMEKVIERSNILSALERVEKNKGAPGIDGMTTQQLRDHLIKEGAQLRMELLNGTYLPQPVRRVEIPKANGGGVRKLGIPTVRDRLVQQAILQVINPIFDPAFSESSFGFRPGKSAQQAIKQAKGFIDTGSKFVVDIDLEAFFDRVNHDKLMHLLRSRIHDQRLLNIIRRFLNAGVMEHGTCVRNEDGVPQGGPLSPCLSNIMLDVLDKELERRGHRFVRFADDCNVYVKTRRAAERVFNSLVEYLEKQLKLRVNLMKSAADFANRRKFLGISFLTKQGSKTKVRLAKPSEERFKARIRELTNRHWGVSLETRISRINEYLRGWSAYFRVVETPSKWSDLQGWLMRRLRCCLLVQWKRPKTRWQKLKGLGLSAEKAAKIAGSRKGPWCLALTPQLHIALGAAYWRKQKLLFLGDLMGNGS